MLLLLWLVSEACQTSMSAKMVFKLNFLDKKTAGCKSPHAQLAGEVAMDLAALCDMYS